MRKINGKLFLALLLGGVVLTGTVFAVHHFQYKRIGRALLFQARHAEDKGQPREHARFLQRYNEFEPRDYEAKAELAKLWAGENFPPRQRRQAVTLLDEVLAYTPEDVELRRLLIKTAMQFPDQGSQKIARDHLEKLLPKRELERWIAADSALRDKNTPLPENMAQPDAARGQLEGYWGQLLEADKKQAEAMHAYRLAIRHAPEEHNSYMRLAYLLRRLPANTPGDRKRNTTEADAIVDAVVENNRSSHDAYLLRWRYRRDFALLALSESREGIKLETAAEDVAESVKRKPESIEVLLAAADLERLRGRAAAEDVSKEPTQRREGLKAHRDLAQGHLKKGLDIVAKNSSATSEYGRFQLLWHQGNLLLDDLDVARGQAEEDNQPVSESARLKEEILPVIEQVRRSQVPAAADYMRGRLLVHEREWSEAARLFEKARALMNDQPDLACQADLYLGQCYERLEEFAQMLKAYGNVLNRDPNSIQALLGIAQARWLSGDLQGALKQYQTVMDQKRVPPRGWIDIARLEIQKAAQTEKPDWKNVDQAIKNAEKLNPSAFVDVALLNAEVLVRKGKLDEARQLLEAERRRDPNEADLHAALVDLALREKRMDRAKSALAEGRREAGDKAALRLAEARLLAVQEGKQANAKIAALANNPGKMSEEDRGRLFSGLAEVLFQNQAMPQARSLWQKMAAMKSQKNNLRLRLLLFDLAMRDTDEKGMVAILDDIQKIEQEAGVYRRYGDALLNIWRARRTPNAQERNDLLTKARADLDRVKNQRRSWAPVFIAQAEIDELKGMPAQAIKQLQAARAAGDTSPALVRRLVALHTAQGDEVAAQDLLNKMRPETLRQNDLAKIQLLLELSKDRSKALDRLRLAVRDDSNDPKDLLFVARVLAKDGTAEELKKAETLFDQALTVAASDPVPYVAKVQFLVEQNRKPEAEALIVRLKEKVPADQAPLALGRCYDLVGETHKAVTAYTEAEKNADPATLKAVAAAHLERGRSAKAQPILRKMAAGTMSNVPSGDVSWAQRALALTLAGGTDFAQFTEALTLVGLKLDGNGKLTGTGDREEPTDSIRTRARVLATQNQKQFRTEAIRLLEGLRNQKAMTPDDQYILSGLYEQQGESQRARDELGELVTRRDTRNPQYLAQYAMVLIAQNRNLSEAEKTIGLLEDLETKSKRGPNGWASVELRARLLEARNKGDEAVKLLKDHVSREGAKPEEVLLVLASLGRQKKFPEAFALCEQTWKDGKCQPEAVGAVSVQLLQVWDKATNSQVADIEKHLTEALKKKPNSVVLMLHLATLHDKRGQYDLAIKQYRAVLEKQANNFVALNNLAWLLALRSTDAHKALDHIDRAIAGMGRRADLLDTRALVHLAMKEPAKAIADLNEAISDAPTPTRLFHLARAYHENRDQAKARDFLQQAKQKKLDVASLHPIEQDEAKKLLAEYR